MSHKPKSKSNVREFELSEEFQDKYSEITRIYTIGKVLVLEYYTGALVQSSYYSNDSIKTSKALREALKESPAISIEFDREGFLHAFDQLLLKSIIQEAKEEKVQIPKSNNKEIAY